MNKFTVSNKLTVIHQEIKKLPIISITVFLRAGNIYESTEQYGITSLTMAMLTKGTKSRIAGRVASEIENIGSSIDADTDKDFATIGISFLKEYTDRALDIFSDVILNPIFPESELKKEKAFAVASLKTRKDRIFTVADDISNATFFKNHPYALPEIGEEKTIKAMERKDLINWHKKIIVSGNILFSAAGDINKEESARLIEKYFINLAEGGEIKENKTTIEPARQEVAEKKNFKQSYLMVSYPAPNVFDYDYSPLKMLTAVVGGRMSGRLFKELREKHSLAYEVNAFFSTRKHRGKYTFYIGLDEKNIEFAAGELEKIVEDLRKNNISEVELDESKKYFNGVFHLQRQTTAKLAWHNGFWEIMGMGYDYDRKYLDSILLVTSAQIKDAVNKYLRQEHQLTVKILSSK